MISEARILAPPRKAIGEGLAAIARCAVREWLEHNFIAILRPISIPRSVKGDEHSVPILRGELGASIKQQAVRCPVPGKRCNGRFLVCTAAGLVSIAAVFRSKYEAAEHAIVVTVRPAVIATRFDLQ